jgi:hypothetical protein
MTLPQPLAQLQTFLTIPSFRVVDLPYGLEVRGICTEMAVHGFIAALKKSQYSL